MGLFKKIFKGEKKGKEEGDAAAEPFGMSNEKDAEIKDTESASADSFKLYKGGRGSFDPKYRELKDEGYQSLLPYNMQVLFGGQKNRPPTYHPARPHWYSSVSKDTIRARVVEGVKVIEQYAFADTKLELVKIPEGVEVIEHGAFDNCKNLTAIKFPSSLKHIESEAFLNCKSLASINFVRVGKIDKDAFAGCTKLESFTIPASLEVDNIAELSIFLHTELPNLKEIKFEEMNKPKKEWIQNNTVLHQLINSRSSNIIYLIESFLESFPAAIKEKNFLGQTPLHLCITNGSTLEITKFIYDQWPDAVNERNEIGQSPIELWEETKESEDNGWKMEIGTIIASDVSPTIATKRRRDDAFVLVKKQAVPYNEPELLRCKHILLEAGDSVAKRSIIHHGSEKDLREYFLEQLATRNQLFDTLLDEFARKIQFKDKKAIQQAAAIQALYGEYIEDNVSKFKHVQIDFSTLYNSAWWYQQEILKLVLRVYNEDHPFCEEMAKTSVERPTIFSSSVLDDAIVGKKEIVEKRKVDWYRKETFDGLKDWLVDGCNGGFTLEGPDQKSLQSLFNKMFIRRGQTQVCIIGDMTRARLHIDKEEDLEKIVSKLRKEFPDTETFKKPKVGFEPFLEQISRFKTLDLDLPKTKLKTKLIPYRFKVNSSQKKRKPYKEEAFNLNFFDGVPEYHRVGNTEMFVAFELQIGLSSELKRLGGDDHYRYERERILDAQPLLKNYIEAAKQEENASATKRKSTSDEHIADTDSHSKQISAILQGNFSSFNLRALGVEKLKGEGTTLRLPDNLCLNNKRFNIWANDKKAYIIDQVMSLDPSLHYCVKSLVVKTDGVSSKLHVGLFARIGPYIVSVSSRYVAGGGDRHFIIEPELNPETLERISPLPLGCKEVYLVAWGTNTKLPWIDVQDIFYNGMELELCRYEEIKDDMPPISFFRRQARDLCTSLYRGCRRWYYDSRRWYRNYGRFQRRLDNIDGYHILLMNAVYTILFGYASWYVHRASSTGDLVSGDRNILAQIGLSICLILLCVRRAFVLLLFVSQLLIGLLFLMTDSKQRKEAVHDLDPVIIMVLILSYYGAFVLFRETGWFVYEYMSVLWTGMEVCSTELSIFWAGLKICSFFGSGYALFWLSLDVLIFLFSIVWESLDIPKPQRSYESGTAKAVDYVAYFFSLIFIVPFICCAVVIFFVASWLLYFLVSYLRS